MPCSSARWTSPRPISPGSPVMRVVASAVRWCFRASWMWARSVSVRLMVCGSVLLALVTATDRLVQRFHRGLRGVITVDVAVAVLTVAMAVAVLAASAGLVDEERGEEAILLG